MSFTKNKLLIKIGIIVTVFLGVIIVLNFLMPDKENGNSILSCEKVPYFACFMFPKSCYPDKGGMGPCPREEKNTLFEYSVQDSDCGYPKSCKSNSSIR